MIGKAKAIHHGINDLRYITGESKNKEKPEKIHHICDNMMPVHLDATGFWNEVNLTLSRGKPLKNSIIRIEISPAKEHTRNYSCEDWEQLWHDFAKEFDSQVLLDKKGNVVAPKTNIAGSKGTVWLHLESDGEIPHLHAAVCRVDEHGNINSDHNIHLRAQRAAEKIARKRGWTTANEIRGINKTSVSADCIDALRSMSRWDWETYVSILKSKGYDVCERTDKDKILRGYVLKKGNAIYKASELGKGRNLMASKIEETWKSVHQISDTTARKVGSNSILSTHKNYFGNYSTYKPDTIPCTLQHNDRSYEYYIPDKVTDIFDEEFDFRTVVNWQELTDFASKVFVGLLQADSAYVSSGGGGGQSDLSWRDKDEDEDDERWARRCAMAAARALGKKYKTRMKR